MNSTTTLHLPEHLAERVVILTDAPPRARGEFVLYWAHHALRAHENPALEAAATLALELGKTLVVYQGLGGRHRYNADRHHRFILEAACDFAAELESIGLHLLFHLPADPAQPGPLSGLLARSSVAVSELYPAPPFPDWYRSHAAAHPDLPLLLLDSSCNLPMTLSPGRPNRAFQFRKTNDVEMRRRVAAGWPAPPEWPKPFRGDAGFEPADLDQPLAEAIAGCHIDHSIPPVTGTAGGSRAGYERWKAFLETGLVHYHRRRNDAALPQAVSRISAYLHYGCVSPFRIAREAVEHGGEGAAKFLDELLTWRELSHHFCFHSDVLESFDALPDWAVESLTRHQADPRPERFDWEQLLRGVTGEPLWDLAQRSLLRRGELHNNVRMSWGKALLNWAPRPQRALKLMIDLNHRLALDGNDPNSYGGLLWCLGQFDRPFPPGPVFGSVRRRSLPKHAARLDMNHYAHQVSVPAGERKLRVAVIGAGLAGLTAARILQDQGHDVIVVDKARGPGGRMSTRRDGNLRFDHGAQYFTARDPRFLRHVVAWQERGLVEEWEARIGIIEGSELSATRADTRRFVAIPGMSAICAALADDLHDCRLNWTAAAVNRDDQGWRIESKDGQSLKAEALVVTLPPDQAQAMLPGYLPGNLSLKVGMMPCWAVMAVLDQPLLARWDAAFINDGPLSWVARQASKPGRPGAEAWVLHANPDWSLEQFENDPAVVSQEMLAAAALLPGSNSFVVEQSVMHRWRYALAREPLLAGALWYPQDALVVAGDWCNGSRVEGAFLSGAAAAGRLLGSRLAGNAH